MRTGRFAWVCWLALSCAAAQGPALPDATPDASPDVAREAGSDVPADVPADLAAEAVALDEALACTPGADRGQCTSDHLGRVVCAENGSGWISQPCGDDSVCLSDDEGCTACRPGNLKCQDDDVVLRCNETGQAYGKAVECNGVQTGQVCRNGACAKLCDLNAKVSSYIGCEYWGADLDNAFIPESGEGGYFNASTAQYAIVVSNTSDKYPATIAISMFDAAVDQEVPVTTDTQGNPLPTDPIPPHGLRVFNLGPRNVDSTVLAPLAYRVVSSIPISAYQFNPLDNVGVFSNDATVLLPSNALGKYYFVMTREQTFDDLKGFLTVIATFPGETQVTVTVTAPTLGDNGIAAMQPGDSKTFLLRRFDTLNIETDAYGADLTGSMVSANHPVAVFGGSEAANAPNTNHCCPDGECTANQIWLTCKDLDNCLCEWPHQNLKPAQDVPCKNNYDCIKYNTCCADHLEMELWPVRAWGETYVATHSYPRGGEKDVWRILAAEDQTAFTTYPPQVNVPVLNRGGYVDFESADHFEIFSKRPVLVGQFLAAQDAPDPNFAGKGPNDAATGDPTFLLSVPVEQFRKDYVFLTPDKYVFDAVNLVVPAGVPVFLDGQELHALDLTFLPAKDILQQVKDQGLKNPADLGKTFGDYALVGTGTWAVWRVVVPDGVHVAEADQPFGVIVYGYDQYVSYGYPAGLNLDDLKLVGDGP